MSVRLTPAEVRSLLSKLCVDLGFCLPPDAIGQLQHEPPAEVAAFTDAVFVAEGLDPVMSDRGLWKQVAGVVSAAFADHCEPQP